MKGRNLVRALAALTALAAPAYLAHAATAIDFDAVSGGGAISLPPYLQCVPYARRVSGIQLFGDAHTWWDQAEGHYSKGNSPRIGAVMAFKPHGNMRLGHVAAVSRVIDSRTVLLRHANWSPINGRRGQIEDNVRAIDVSPDNDWSAVRVWFDPVQNLGSTHWPVQGFIYNSRASTPRRDTETAVRATSERPATTRRAVSTTNTGSRTTPTRATSTGAIVTAEYRPGFTPVRIARISDPIGDIVAGRRR